MQAVSRNLLIFACVAIAAMLPAFASATGNASMLTFHAEARYRYIATDNSRLIPGNDMRQGQFCGIVGTDLHLIPQLRFHGDFGTGQVDRDRGASVANLQRRLSLQQLFAEVRRTAGTTLVGAILGLRNSPMVPSVDQHQRRQQPDSNPALLFSGHAGMAPGDRDTTCRGTPSCRTCCSRESIRPTRND